MTEERHNDIDLNLRRGWCSCGRKIKLNEFSCTEFVNILKTDRSFVHVGPKSTVIRRAL